MPTELPRKSSEGWGSSVGDRRAPSNHGQCWSDNCCATVPRHPVVGDHGGTQKGHMNKLSWEPGTWWPGCRAGWHSSERKRLCAPGGSAVGRGYPSGPEWGSIWPRGRVRILEARGTRAPQLACHMGGGPSVLLHLVPHPPVESATLCHCFCGSCHCQPRVPFFLVASAPSWSRLSAFSRSLCSQQSTLSVQVTVGCGAFGQAHRTPSRSSGSLLNTIQRPPHGRVPGPLFSEEPVYVQSMATTLEGLGAGRALG